MRKKIVILCVALWLAAWATPQVLAEEIMFETPLPASESEGTSSGQEANANTEANQGIPCTPDGTSSDTMPQAPAPGEDTGITVPVDQENLNPAVPQQATPVEEIMIAEFATPLINSPANRTHNIVLALSSLNGCVIAPGEVFSFNRTVGPRTTARGYRTAKIIRNKRFVDGVGGGVCQVATTLYNTALSAGLKVIERHPHSLRVTYVPAGKDATVSFGVQDLRFINTQQFRVKIRAVIEKGYVKISMIRSDVGQGDPAALIKLPASGEEITPVGQQAGT